jgi:hypothetical protein
LSQGAIKTEDRDSETMTAVLDHIRDAIKEKIAAFAEKFIKGIPDLN